MVYQPGLSFCPCSPRTGIPAAGGLKSIGERDDSMYVHLVFCSFQGKREQEMTRSLFRSVQAPEHERL